VKIILQNRNWGVLIFFIPDLTSRQINYPRVLENNSGIKGAYNCVNYKNLLISLNINEFEPKSRIDSAFKSLFYGHDAQ
jgi:hypothetical protein